MASPDMTSRPIDAVFARADRISHIKEAWMEEVLADYARYLCILVMGFLERSVERVFQDYVDSLGDPRVSSYVEEKFQYERFMRVADIREIAKEFDQDWENRLNSKMTDKHKAAIGNLHSQRKNIAHGRDSDLTYRQVYDAYNLIKETVGFLEEIVGVTPSRYPRA